MEHSMRLRGFKNSGKGQKGWAESFMIFDKSFVKDWLYISARLWAFRALAFFCFCLDPGRSRMQTGSYGPTQLGCHQRSGGLGSPSRECPFGGLRVVDSHLWLEAVPGLYLNRSWQSRTPIPHDVTDMSCLVTNLTDFIAKLFTRLEASAETDTYGLLRHVNLTEAHRGIVTSSLSEKLTGRRPLWSIFWKLLTHSRHNYQAATRFKMFPCRFTLAWKTSVWFCDLCWFYSFPISFFWMHVAWWFWCIA